MHVDKVEHLREAFLEGARPGLGVAVKTWRAAHGADILQQFAVVPLGEADGMDHDLAVAVLQKLAEGGLRARQVPGARVLTVGHEHHSHRAANGLLCQKRRCLAEGRLEAGHACHAAGEDLLRGGAPGVGVIQNEGQLMLAGARLAHHVADGILHLRIGAAHGAGAVHDEKRFAGAGRYKLGVTGMELRGFDAKHESGKGIVSLPIVRHGGLSGELGLRRGHAVRRAP
mmetsp:Transcript_115795/g.332682  ORF Transcript_115795/g.332682 Transcript_115795/m.332682 type:complete len:228 (-) Transcript_115795:731-1414(-)